MIMRNLFGSAAIVALISGSAVGLAAAQEQNTTETGQTQQTTPSATETPAATGQDATQGSGQQTGSAETQTSNPGQNRLIAKVNDVEIREGDVANAIQNLPPQVQQMPPQMLLPIVVEQLLTRELILAQGRAENLQADPAVVAIVEPQTKALQDQAVVNVWIERELAERMTDERINAAYEAFKAANPNATVTLEAARPQLEQALRQEAMQQLSAELREGAAIVFYDAAGNPVPENATGGAAAAGGENSITEQSGDAGAASGSEPAPKN